MYSIHIISSEAEKLRLPFIDKRTKQWRDAKELTFNTYLKTTLPFKYCHPGQAFVIPKWQMGRNQLRLARNIMRRINRRYRAYFELVEHYEHWEFVRLL